MDIRNWSMNDVMQLPDHCFGTRFLIGCCAKATAPALGFDISEIAFPEHCIIWSVSFWQHKNSVAWGQIRLALGDKLPATAAEFDSLDPLLPGIGREGARPRQIISENFTFVTLTKIRFPLHTAGRRLVLAITAAASGSLEIQVVVTVSSIPKSIPDHLLTPQTNKIINLLESIYKWSRK